jgi:hypothetical protein
MTEGLVTWSAVAAPSAVIAAPAAGEHLATDSEGDVDIVVSLDAPASIKTIDVTLDGAVVATRAFTRGEVSLYEESIRVSAAGLHEVRLSMTDWNDVVTDAEPIQFFADTAPPVLTVDDSDITLGRTWAVGTDFYRFSGTVVDDGTLASVQIKVNGSRWQEVSFGGGVWSTALHVPDADGSTLLVSVRAFDLAGRLSSVGSTPSVDLAPEQATPYVRPDTAIDSGPVATGAPASAVFRFSGIPGDSGVAGYTCQLDGFEAALCSDGVAFEDLAAGRHVLEVAAIDELGYVDLSPASWSWAVAAAGPQPQLLSKPARTTTQRAAEFTFTGGGRATFECALDEGAPEPCSSPYRVESLPNGRHTFRVWAAVGGSSGTAVSYTWSVINGAPVVEDQSAKVVQNDTIGRSLTLGVTDVDPVTFRIVEQPEHGYLEGIPPNVVYVPFREYVGPDQFTFEADDSQVVSNLGTVSVLVEAPDTDPPTITSPGDQTVRSAYPGTAPIEYRLPTAIDNSGPVSIECNPPSGTVFRPGATVVTCRTEDAAGNTAIVRFTIDHIVGDDDFTLPATGNGHLPLAEGFLLLVLGCALVFVARRRLVALLNGRR